MKSGKIVDFIIYILSFAMAVLLIIFQNNLSYLFCIASIFFILLGVCYLFKNSNYSLVLIAMGIGGLTTYLIYINKVLNYYDCYTFMFALSLCLLLSLTVIKAVIDRKKVYKTYNIKVIGKVTDLLKNPNTKKEYYKPVYQYQIKDKIFEVVYPSYKKRFIPNIGDEITILIDPKDNQETYFLPERKEDIFNISTSIFFIVTCIIIIFSLF